MKIKYGVRVQRENAIDFRNYVVDYSVTGSPALSGADLPRAVDFLGGAVRGVDFERAFEEGWITKKLTPVLVVPNTGGQMDYNPSNARRMASIDDALIVFDEQLKELAHKGVFAIPGTVYLIEKLSE